MNSKSTSGSGTKVRSKRSLEKIKLVSKNMLTKKLKLQMNSEDILSLGFQKEDNK